MARIYNSEFHRRVAAESGVDVREIARITYHIEEEIEEAVSRGDTVILRGFGVFYRGDVPARTLRGKSYPASIRGTVPAGDGAAAVRQRRDLAAPEPVGAEFVRRKLGCNNGRYETRNAATQAPRMGHAVQGILGL